MAADWRTSFSSYLGVHLALDRLHSTSTASSPGSGCALTTCSVSVLSSAAKSLHNFFTKSACSYRQNVLWFHHQTPQRTHVLSSGLQDTAITGELRNLTQHERTRSSDPSTKAISHGKQPPHATLQDIADQSRNLDTSNRTPLISPLLFHSLA